MSEFSQSQTLSLPELYAVAHQHFTDAGEKGTMSTDSTAVADIEKALSAVQSEAIFSKNEEMDDISTSSIKLQHLKEAKESISLYLDMCLRLKVLHEDEARCLNSDNQLGPEERRRIKIEKFKRHKESKERLQSLTRLLLLTKDDTDFDHEEEIRTMAILQLTMYAQEGLDEISSIDQEIPIALHMLEMEKQRELKEGRAPRSDLTSDRISVSEPPKPGEGPGLKVVRMNKVGDQITTRQETIKANVFKSTIAAPTMTLEEFGRLEMEDAIARQKREQENANMQAQAGAEMSTRRYNQLYADGDEDNIDLVEQAKINDREWDDWKDNNPRGIGNKANKRY